MNNLQSSYDNRHEWCLHYKYILALASVVNYDHKRDATIWSVTYYRLLASLDDDSRVIINNHYMFIIQATVKVHDSE
jgi:hypothetical protein